MQSLHDPRTLRPPTLDTSAEHFLRTWQSRGVQVVVFDFDNTILQVHSRGAKQSSNEAELKAYVHKLRDAISPSFLAIVHTANRLPRRHRVKLGIASFADERVIKGGQGIGGQRLIARVLEPFLTRDESSIPIVAFNPALDVHDDDDDENKTSDQERANKNMHLLRLARFYGLTSPRQLLLIDDDMNNIEAAKLEGYATLHVVGSKGFQL